MTTYVVIFLFLIGSTLEFPSIIKYRVYNLFARECIVSSYDMVENIDSKSPYSYFHTVWRTVTYHAKGTKGACHPVLPSPDSYLHECRRRGL